MGCHYHLLNFIPIHLKVLIPDKNENIPSKYTFVDKNKKLKEKKYLINALNIFYKRGKWWQWTLQKEKCIIELIIYVYYSYPINYVIYCDNSKL